MRRRYGKLLVVVLLASLPVGVMVWLERSTAQRSEALRVARAELQRLEQQLSLLKAPEMQQSLSVLEEGLDVLRIRLVEALTQQERPAGVVKVEFDQSLLPRTLGGSGAEAVRVLRLQLDMHVQHAAAFLDMLALIDDATPLWPQEVQACTIHRLPEKNLKTGCVLDFYHWSPDSQQASRASGDRQGTDKGNVS